MGALGVFPLINALTEKRALGASKHSVAATTEALAGYVEVSFGHDARLLRHIGGPQVEDIFVLTKGRHAQRANTKPPSKRRRPASISTPSWNFSTSG